MTEKESHEKDQEQRTSTNGIQKSLILTESVDATFSPREKINNSLLESPSMKNKTGGKKNSVVKIQIENLEQFIAYVYSRKGQKVVLKPIIEKAICRHSRLSSDARNNLLVIARSDMLLAVPRQLMLSIGEVVGYPSLRDEIYEFITEVMKQHPIFATEELQSTLKDYYEISVMRSLELLTKRNTEKVQELSSIPPKKASELKYNAINCLAIWIAEKRKITATDLTLSLNAALWQPEAAAIHNITTRVRLITELQELAGVGLACQAFREKLIEQEYRATSAKEAAAAAKEEVHSAQLEIERLRLTLEDRNAEISAYREQLESQKEQNDIALIHLRNEHEVQRSRYLRRLKNDAHLLAEGLHALRREEPKVRVMDDHAERVLESLRDEITQLEVEG